MVALGHLTIRASVPGISADCWARGVVARSRDHIEDAKEARPAVDRPNGHFRFLPGDNHVFIRLPDC